ncbi:MAG: hypothetical protein Q9204_005860 [Flavoplaca sp. TL-2023a]
MGAGLEARSCFDALAHAPRSAQQEIWLPRQARPPSPPGTVISPTAVYGNDTKCAVFASLKSNVPHGQASALNISQAAHAIIMNCVIPRRLGGWAGNIGGDDRVGVLIQASKTQAQCGAPVSRASERSCGYILGDMIKSADGEDFGRPGLPSPSRFDLVSPSNTEPTQHPPLTPTYTYLTSFAADGGCMIVIDRSPGKVLPVRANWLLVWQSAEIITAACIRGGNGGEAQVPDLSGSTAGGLKVQILDEPAGERLLDGGGENISAVAAAQM